MLTRVFSFSTCGTLHFCKGLVEPMSSYNKQKKKRQVNKGKCMAL
jgi:hypothetical protein